MEKYHKQDVAPIEKENERDDNYKSDNPQIDSDRTRNKAILPCCEKKLLN